MKPPTIPDATPIDVNLIKPFVSRAREKSGYDAMKAAIKKHGLKIPIEVRDITGRSPDKRRRPDGGTYRFELIKGEGRTLAHVDLKLEKIPAFIVNVAEADIPGRFLAENMMRRPQSWLEKARLVKAEFDGGSSPEEVAKLLCIEEKHALRLLRIITRAGSEDDLKELSVGEAEALTALPAKGQAIVLEVMRETGERQIKSIVNKAREIIDRKEELSKTALKKSLTRIREDLHRIREQLKVKRRHDSIGPQNVELAFSDPFFRAAAIKAGINVEKFERACK